MAKAPEWINRLAKAQGEALRKIRLKKGLTCEQAARELGLEPILWYQALEKGKRPLALWIVRRAIGWRKGKTYTRESPRETHGYVAKVKGFVKLSVRLPKVVRKRLKVNAEACAMTSEELIYFAIKNLLDDKKTLTNLEKCVSIVDESRINAMLSETPELWQFLERDMPIVEQLGGQIPAKKEPEVERVVEGSTVEVGPSFSEDEELWTIEEM